MKIFLFLLIFPLLSFGQEPLQERLEKASKKAKKPAKKLVKKHEDVKNNSRLNGEVFEKLLSDPNISQEEVQQSMVQEIEYLTSCLENNELSPMDRHWIKEILNIAEKLKEPYFIEEGTYDVVECSNQVGLTQYSVEVKRDPENPGQLFIHNFYNVGNKYKIKANQTGSEIEVKPQTYNASHVASLPVYSKAEAKKQYEIDFGHQKKKTPVYDCTEYTSQVLPNGNFNMAITTNDGSSIDHCTMSFTRQIDKKFNIKPYEPPSNYFDKR